MNIEKLVRKNILNLKPYTSARQSHMEGVLLDANENSFGSVVDEFKSSNFNRYPDPFQKALRKKTSDYLGISESNLIFGVGSDEIIDLLIRTFCEPRIDNVVVCEPTYGMYRVACDINNVDVINAPLNDKYDVEYETVLSHIDNNTKILFLCSPNNPTSNLLDKNVIRKLISELNLIVVIDEAYIDFANDEGFLKEATTLPNLVVMRTFSKAWGMAGLRCGYCVAHEEIISFLFKVKMPYNINKLTAMTVTKAIDNAALKEQYVKEIMAQREFLFHQLKRNKKVINVLPTDTNFISFKVENPREVYNYLEKNGVIIRDRSNQYNFQGYLRVTVGTPSENELFLKKLDEIL
ncbi:histidinol-phosphate transaminase [Melioribacter sp. OK-6-Me]|uniref:histidinol-phosphate transaminase n=1 Tax=unclassified Melioribacter TaxID=2627329 RepID=UPI003EDA3B21